MTRASASRRIRAGTAISDANLASVGLDSGSGLLTFYCGVDLEMNLPPLPLTKRTLYPGNKSLTYYSLESLEQAGIASLDRLPFSIRVLLENSLRHAGPRAVTPEHVTALANWSAE